ncbi:DUF6607 family protein [Niabella beijingensis]|uniref:DUF6607 family protein n=1 Tax=Niabella beijingensis TaxID=2872700 RepID=UPI001CBE1DBD|nr:DUF6607 family protein [Niabella beijingensis]MBZ4189620.1 hypothetical protein [Niabella beijingensis]
MKKIVLILSAAVTTATAMAQTGKENVDKLCGCFEVSFKYAETFAPGKDYKFHEREQIIGVTELALPLINTDRKVVIQHLLVMGNGTIVKHWREDWTYENPVQWVYKGDKVWEKASLPAAEVKGRWSQSVWEVTDAPRYQGSAPWQVVNGRTIWESTADAPLPRREYTQRSDYNILNRTNRLMITEKGYDHVQENKKIIRASGTDKLLVEERGLNGYEKLDKEDCAAGEKYWEEHKGFWLALEEEWAKILDSRNRIKLTEKTGDSDLMARLFEMADEWKEKKLTAADVNSKIKTVLEKHVQ